MPRVPTADGQQVGPGGNQSAYLRAPEASDIAARQLQGFGQAMEGFGQASGQIAGDMKRQADELIVTDALNQTTHANLPTRHRKLPAGQLAFQFGDTLPQAIDGFRTVAALYLKAGFDPRHPGRQSLAAGR